MVHKAFREALGETATQAGSENSPGRFRFDFSATGAIPHSVMADVEARVNDVVIDDLAVHAEVMTQSEAVKAGAMALFGEKYGDQVRVISVGDWARELCGGTHAGRSGQLGVVKLLGEASIGSGVRRVEALVGGDAYRFLAREHVLVAQLSEALKVRPEELPERVDDILERLRAAEKEIDKDPGRSSCWPPAPTSRPARPTSRASRWSRTAIDGAAGGDVRTLALDVRGRLPADAPGVVVVIGVADGKVSVVAAVNDEAQARGQSANELVRAIGPLVGGKGGGKADVAQGGGTDASRVDEALALVAAEVARTVGRMRHGRTPRDRPRRRPDRRGPQRPVRVPGQPGRDGPPRQGRPAPDRPRSSQESEGMEVVVGLPRSLSGGEGPAAAKTREFARLAGAPGGAGAGATVRRTAHHGVGRGYAARPGPQGQRPEIGGRPGGRRTDPAARPRHRAGDGAPAG